MEPTNLNLPSSDPGDDHGLESRLRQSLPPLPDAGFSGRVMAALPPRQSPYRSLRTTLCAIAGAAGVAFAAQKIPADSLSAAATVMQANLQQISAALGEASTSTDAAAAIAFTVTAGSLVFAFRRNFRLS